MLKKRFSTLFSILLMLTIFLFPVAASTYACKPWDMFIEFQYHNHVDSNGYVWTVQYAVCYSYEEVDIYWEFLDAY